MSSNQFNTIRINTPHNHINIAAVGAVPKRAHTNSIFNVALLYIYTIPNIQYTDYTHSFCYTLVHTAADATIKLCLRFRLALIEIRRTRQAIMRKLNETNAITHILPFTVFIVYITQSRSKEVCQ